MRYFNFDSLIGKYSQEFTVISEKNGSYDDYGIWQTSNTTEVKKGAIIGISERKIYRSNGVLTEMDKELYMTEPLGNLKNIYIVFESVKYEVVASSQNNSEFTGAWQYTLKYVSAFGGGNNG